MICGPEKCVGCGNCLQVCPIGAITMQVDAYGFNIAHLDNKKCLRCARCAKVCPGLDIHKEFKKVPCHAAQAKSGEILKESSSGGLFSVLAEKIIEDNGVVCGATQEEGSCKVYHRFITKKEQIPILRKSKYVQSDLRGTIAETIEYLNNDIPVLFAGTPCQISALKKRITLAKVPIQKLFTVDLVCHGVPSAKFYHDYITFVEKRKNIKINQLIFRSKQDGWNYGNLYYRQADGLSGKLKNSYYADYFGWGYLFRDACYQCPKAGSVREGDITLADFWGIEKYISAETFPNLKAGTSMVLLNTEQGEKLFHTIENRIWYYSLDAKIACKENHQLERPMKINQNRRRLIFNCYKVFGANGVEVFYQVERKLMRIMTRFRKE